MEKTIDFLILTHNSKNYIEKLLNNIINLQDFNNKIHKIIILDDNSIDNTLELIIDFLNESNISNYELIKLDKKYGVFYNRVLLLEHSNNDYAFFIDDDDWVDNNMIKVFNECSVYNYDLIYLKRVFVFKDHMINKEEKDGIHVENLDFIKFMFNKQTEMYTTGIFIQNSLIRNTLNYINKQDMLDIYIFEDIPITFLFITLSKKKLIADSIYFYNKTNQNSLSTKNNKNFVNQNTTKIINFVQKIFHLLPNDLKNKIEIKNFFFLVKLWLSWLILQTATNIKQINEIRKIRNKYLKNEKINDFIFDYTNLLIWIIIKHKTLSVLFFLYKKYFKKT